MPTHSNFQINPVIRLHWVTWRDEYVVFDETSGQTHQLDPVRAYVLNVFSEGPQNFDSLRHELERIVTFTADAALPDILTQVLAEFETNGLIEAVKP